MFQMLESLDDNEIYAINSIITTTYLVISYWFQSSADPGLPTICGKNHGQHGKTKKLSMVSLLWSIDELSTRKSFIFKPY